MGCARIWSVCYNITTGKKACMLQRQSNLRDKYKIICSTVHPLNWSAVPRHPFSLHLSSTQLPALCSEASPTCSALISCGKVRSFSAWKKGPWWSWICGLHTHTQSLSDRGMSVLFQNKIAECFVWSTVEGGLWWNRGVYTWKIAVLLLTPEANIQHARHTSTCQYQHHWPLMGSQAGRTGRPWTREKTKREKGPNSFIWWVHDQSQHQNHTVGFQQECTHH